MQGKYAQVELHCHKGYCQSVWQTGTGSEAIQPVLSIAATHCSLLTAGLTARQVCTGAAAGTRVCQAGLQPAEQHRNRGDANSAEHFLVL